jgi:hypothetical protein
VSLPGEVASTAVALARAKKRNNALVALLCAIVPAIFLAYRQQPHSRQWIVGFAVGLIWGNGFEYAYHRWLLHWPKSIFGRGHLEHHRTAGGAEQAEHITFGRNPLNVVALFLGNGILLLLIEFLFKVRIAPGVLIGWAVYLITLEEIHWRLHMESWLPPGLRFARAYHLSHHDIPNRRYNVFLPLFDFLLGNNKLPTNRLVTESASRHSSR